MNHKRNFGQYFTQYNPFENEGFLEWAQSCQLQNHKILEPFAGSNNLIVMLQAIGLCKSFLSFDISPQNSSVQFQDTLYNFPKNFSVCVTNPPYLAKNSAKRRGLHYPQTKYNDLYKYALDKCLTNCDFIAAIIPASFLNSKLFRNRLSHYILLNCKMFHDTEHPVCLALFQKNSQNTKIYEGKKYLGYLKGFEKKIPNPLETNTSIRFNEKNGNLGFIAIDNTKEPSIRFCKGNTISSDKIHHSSRSITRIAINTNINGLIQKLNHRIKDFRTETCDLFLTPFKGIRKDQKLRRRMDYSLTRKLIIDTIKC